MLPLAANSSASADVPSNLGRSCCCPCWPGNTNRRGAHASHGDAPPVLWPSFLLLPGDLSKAAGQPSSGCTRALASVLTPQEPRAPPSVHMHCRDPRCSELWAAPLGVHVQSPGRGASWVHVLTYVLLEECLLVETLTEYSGAPGKYPENLSNSSALSSALRVPRQRHWAIVDSEPLRHCAGKGNLKNVPKIPFPYFDVLCVFLQRQTHFSPPFISEKP